jgi:hypothetical protein
MLELHTLSLPFTTSPVKPPSHRANNTQVLELHTLGLPFTTPPVKPHTRRANNTQVLELHTLGLHFTSTHNNHYHKIPLQVLTTTTQSHYSQSSTFQHIPQYHHTHTHTHTHTHIYIYPISCYSILNNFHINFDHLNIILNSTLHNSITNTYLHQNPIPYTTKIHQHPFIRTIYNPIYPNSITNNFINKFHNHKQPSTKNVNLSS